MERSKKIMIQERDLLFDMYLQFADKIALWGNRTYVVRKSFSKELLVQHFEDEMAKISERMRWLDTHICPPDRRNKDLTEIY